MLEARRHFHYPSLTGTRLRLSSSPPFLLISSFMSHTVTSIILMPLLVHIGVKAGHPVLLTVLR